MNEETEGGVMSAGQTGEEKRGLDRRAFLKAAGTIAVVCAGAGLGPLLMRRDQLFRRSMVLMGTIGEIQLVHDDAEKVNSAMDAAFDEVLRIERLMSHFREDSDVGRVNKSGFTKDVFVSAETSEVLARGLHWASATGGRFDPGIGSLSRIWNIGRSSEPPEADLLETYLNGGFYKQIQLRDRGDGAVVALSQKLTALDLGGIAKGYAADRAIDVLRKKGIQRALVNLGGDVVAIGGKSSSESWRIGVKDPRNPGKIARVLHLKNQAVATSGNYEHFFRLKSTGRLYHHLLDPLTAAPKREDFFSLTVVGGNCCDADALSTALFLMDDQRGDRLLEDHTAGFTAVRLA